MLTLCKHLPCGLSETIVHQRTRTTDWVAKTRLTSSVCLGQKEVRDCCHSSWAQKSSGSLAKAQSSGSLNSVSVTGRDCSLQEHRSSNFHFSVCPETVDLRRPLSLWLQNTGILHPSPLGCDVMCDCCSSFASSDRVKELHCHTQQVCPSHRTWRGWPSVDRLCPVQHETHPATH